MSMYVPHALCVFIGVPLGAVRRVVDATLAGDALQPMVDRPQVEGRLLIRKPVSQLHWSKEEESSLETPPNWN